MYRSFSEIRAALSSGQTTCQELVRHYLKNIQQRNAELNLFLEVYEQEALAKAAEVDQKLAAGTAGNLAGMVIGVKDVLCVKGHGLQAASRILDGFVSQFTAPSIQKLMDADAIIIGRQNCDEFAMGSSNENSAFGPARNNIDPSRAPGGSSGASAAAVSADMCLVSLGSDTGGSVRQPAAFCGVVGLKPTYGRISRYGLIAYASSFDTIGIIGKSVDDIALVLETMAGADGFDSTASTRPVPAYSTSPSFSGSKKIAYLKESVGEGIQPEIREKMQERIAFLKSEGHELTEVAFPFLEYILPTYYILTTAEASTNLSRYDGIRYGYRTPGDQELETMYKKTRSEGFGAEVKRRIMLGTFVLSASYYDAYFTKAQKVRRLIKEKTDELLSRFDYLILPTTPSTAFEIGKYNESNMLEMYLADLFTVQANVAGVPAVSVPIGYDAKGLPIGLQVMSAAFSEEELLRFAKYLHQHSGELVA